MTKHSSGTAGFAVITASPASASASSIPLSSRLLLLPPTPPCLLEPFSSHCQFNVIMSGYDRALSGKQPQLQLHLHAN